MPLVLHGSSGVPDADLRRAVAAGMTKVNIATQLNKVFTAAVRDVLAARPDLVDPRKYLGPARDAVTEEAARLLRVLTAPVLAALNGLSPLGRSGDHELVAEELAIVSVNVAQPAVLLRHPGGDVISGIATRPVQRRPSG